MADETKTKAAGEVKNTGLEDANAELETQLKESKEAQEEAEKATVIAEAATKKAEAALKKLTAAQNKEATKNYGKSAKYMSVKLSIFHPYQNIRLNPDVPTTCKLDSWLDSQIKAGIVKKC